MRTNLIRIYKSVHTWTGILSGMALFIAFYAGAISIFKEPLTRWASPPPVATNFVPLADAQQLITGTLQIQPEVAKAFFIHLQEAEHIPARLSWNIPKEGADDHDQLSINHYLATFDPDGDVYIQETHPSKLGEFIDVLHRVVGLPVDNDSNRLIMGVIAVLYTVALVSGVIVLLPSLVKDFFALRVGKNLKRMWLDAHNVLGILSLPLHLVMALTAVVFAFHDGFYYLQNQFIHQKNPLSALQGNRGISEPAATFDPASMLPPEELVALAQARSSGFQPSALQYLNVTEPRAVVRVWGKDATALSPRAVGGFIALNPYNGKTLNSDYLPGQQDIPNTIVSSFFALHMAAFGGAWVKWMYFLLSLAGAWLFYSGNLLWIESRRRKASRESNSPQPIQRLDTRLMASATVGICLGCICGISLTIVAGKWLYGHVDDLTSWHVLIYYAVFFASIIWAFIRGGASASVHLLWLASAFTALIPSTTLLAWLFPSLGLWGHTNIAALSVDITALIAALCFTWIARTTQRRIRSGASDSVWSISKNAV